MELQKKYLITNFLIFNLLFLSGCKAGKIEFNNKNLKSKTDSPIQLNNAPPVDISNTSQNSKACNGNTCYYVSYKIGQQRPEGFQTKGPYNIKAVIRLNQ